MSIATEITRLQTAKADLKTAIEGKGVTVPSATKIDGYADLVEAIQTGGGGGVDANSILNHEISGSVSSDASTVSNFSYLGQPITSVSLPNITTFKNINGSAGMGTVGLFAYCTQLQNFSAPKATQTCDYLLYGCTALEALKLEKLTDSGAELCNGCTNLVTVVLPSAKTLYRSAFYGCTKLKAVDFLGGSQIHNTVFQNDSVFNTLIIRGGTVCPLSNINSFNNTPFASGGTGGTLYVPSALVSSYQAATNWSTILGYANNSIAAIEGSQYENYYADGTPIPTT